MQKSRTCLLVFHRSINQPRNSFWRSTLFTNSKSCSTRVAHDQTENAPERGQKEPTTYKLSKILSMRGVCSRKEAEELITQGRLKIDNKVHLNVGTRLPLYTKNLVIDNRPLQPFHAWDWKPKLWVHYKMPEILISHKDDRNRKTLFPILKEMLAKDRQANPLLSVVGIF